MPGVRELYGLVNAGILLLEKGDWQEPSVSRRMDGRHVTHGPEHLF